MITFNFDKSGRVKSPPELFVGYNFIQNTSSLELYSKR